MIANISENELFSVYFDKQILSGFVVGDVGYNNFKYVEGCKAKRKEEHYTMHFILSGKGVFNVCDNTYELEAGDLFYCAPDELFSYYPNEEDPWEYVWFGFYGDSSDDVLNLIGLNSKDHIKKSAVTDDIVKKIDEFLLGLNKNANKNSLSAISAFIGILSSLAIEDSQPPKHENMTRRYVKRARNCIENNFADSEFRIEHVGHLLFLNHTYLCRLFLSETGTTMVGYLRECRLNAAKKLLASTDKTVREISLESGFGDYPHFCKIFLAEIGVTPSGYREKVKKMMQIL